MSLSTDDLEVAMSARQSETPTPAQIGAGYLAGNLLPALAILAIGAVPTLVLAVAAQVAIFVAVNSDSSDTKK
jgi:hypothetical protein